MKCVPCGNRGQTARSMERKVSDTAKMMLAEKSRLRTGCFWVEQAMLSRAARQGR